MVLVDGGGVSASWKIIKLVYLQGDRNGGHTFRILREHGL